jgi:predicted GNAT superfamily acetyltransferase
VTSPANADSLAFHDALGFEREGVAENYDGAGASRVLLAKRLA